MRLESSRQGSPTKWCDLDIWSSPNDKFSVVMTYGLVTPQGDEILQPLKSLSPEGGEYYTDAETRLLAKIKNREDIGYVKIEPKQTT